VSERGVTDHVVNLDIPRAHDVSSRDRWARPLLSVRGGGKIEVGDNVEIRHMAIVGMPLLHCLQEPRRGIYGCASVPE